LEELENKYSSCNKKLEKSEIISEFRKILNLLEEEIKTLYSKNNINKNKKNETKNETKNKDTIINLGLTYQKNANITNILNEINIKKTSIFSLNEEKEKDNNHYVSISPKHRDPKNLKNFKKEKDFSKFSRNNSDEICSSLIKSQVLIDKILHIENILRNYLKDSHNFFKTKSIDEFIENENSQENSNSGYNQNNRIPEFDKFQNILLDSENSKKNFQKKFTFESENKFTSAIATNVINSNYSIPSCFKNFFEEKENKILKEHNYSSVNFTKEGLKYNFSNTDCKKPFNKFVSNYNENTKFLNLCDQKANEHTISDFGDNGISSFTIDGETKIKITNFAENMQGNYINENKRRPKFIKRQSSILTESMSIQENTSEFDNDNISSILDEDKMQID